MTHMATQRRVAMPPGAESTLTARHGQGKMRSGLTWRARRAYDELMMWNQ
jgi:hypothetical protein